MLKKTIGKRIRPLPIRLNLSQNRFSAKPGISRGTLNDIENSKYFHSYSVIYDIIKIFNINHA